MTRSLVVFHAGGVTGPQQSLFPAATWLGSMGSVDFIVPEPGPIEQQYRQLGSVSVLDYSPLIYAQGLGEGVRLARQIASEVRMFRRELRRRRPDIVVAVTTVLPALTVAARLERIPTFVYAAELHEQPWTAGSLRRLGGVLLSWGTALASNGIVCCSETVARQFPSRIGTRMSVAYPPIDPEYEGGSRERGRSRLGLGPDTTCLLAVGSISRGRGQDVALRALVLIRQRFATARLVLVGMPHPRPIDLQFARELRSLAESLNVADAVVFAGRVGTGASPEAMADVYAAADVVVNPARVAEAFGRVGPEALVAGRPVVASRVGGIPEVLRDGRDALLVPPDDPSALTAAVTRLLDDPALRERLVASGRRRAFDSFGPAQTVEAWRAVVEPVLRRPRR